MSDKEIPFSEIEETNEILGIGSYGKVFQVSYFGAVCAAKELGSCSGRCSATDNVKVENDLKDQPLIQLRHPNIVQILGFYFKPDPSTVRPVLVMEKMECSLSTFLASHPDVSNGVKVSILLDISLGLRYLHGQKPPVAHGNLTSNNILLTSQLQAKISDVGIIQMMGNQKEGHVQCEPFMAPEVRTSMLNRMLTKSTLHPSADIFSFGTVVLHTITQEQPEPLADDSVKQSVNPQTEVERHQLQINLLAARSKSLKSLVTACMDNDPNKRPTITQVSEKMKKWSEKLPVVNKNSIAWQAEVEEAIKQQNDLEKKLANEIKVKEQLQIQNENLLKLIRVNCTALLEKTLKIQNEGNDSTKQTQVEQSQQISKITKANSLQHRFNSGNIPKSFQLVLKKDSSQDATNSALEYVKFQSKLEDLPVAITKCPHHPNYDLSIYCIDCEVELCYMCSSNHHNHKVQYFSVLFYDKNMESNMQRLLKEIKIKKSELDQKNIETQKKATQRREAVKAGFANLHKIIDKQEKRVLQRLALQVENAEKEHDLYLNIYSMRIAQLKAFLNTMEQARLISKKEYYKSSKSLIQHGNSLLRIGKDVKVSISDGFLEIPTGKFESICSEIVALGISPDAKMCCLVSSPKVVLANRKETFVVIMKDEEGHTISNCKDTLAVELARTYTSFSVNVPTDVKELGDGRYEVCYMLKYSGEYHLIIKVCGIDIPGTPCKITCKLSNLSPSLPVTTAPSPLPGEAVSDHYQFKIKPIKNYGSNCYLNSVLQAFSQTTAVVEIGERCNDGTPRHYNLKGLSYGDELKIAVSGSIGALHKKFQALFKEVSTPKGSSFIDPQSILQQIATKNPRFGKHTQEDSHEVLRCLLTEMKNEELERMEEKIHQHFGVGKDQSLASLDGETKLMLKNYLRMASNTGVTPIEKVVRGVRLNTVICRKCHTPIQSEEAFFDISLQIPDDAPAARTSAYGAYSWQNINTQQSYSTSHQHIYKQSSHGDTSAHSTALDADCVQSLLVAENMFHQPSTNVTCTQQLTGLEKSLAAHTSVDNMDENNKFVCTECNKSIGGEVLNLVCKQLLIHQLPQVLILHLKRFTVGPYTVTKNKDHVSFPPMLNMTPYSSNACLEKFGDSKNNILYGLYAVVEHIGSTLSVGHYIAYVRRRPKRDKPKSSQAAKVKWIYDEAAAHDGMWFRTSDITITECSRGFKDVEKSEAYLLFYELLPSKLL